MMLHRIIGAVVFSAFCTLSTASPLLLTFVPTAGNGSGTITLPDQSLVTDGFYKFEYNFTDPGQTSPPLLPSGWAQATFPLANNETGLPTETILGGRNFPSSIYILDFTYLGNGFASGGFYVLDASTDEQFAFNWQGESYYTNGTLTPVVIGEIPGLWAVTSLVSEPSALHLMLLGLLSAIGMRVRQRSKSKRELSFK